MAMELVPSPLRTLDLSQTQKTPLCIFSSSLDRMRDSLLDISPHAEPCRYRLLECAAFASNRELKIFEFDNISNISYTAVAYTWRGNETNNHDPSDSTYWKDVHGCFQVKGAEDGDPISLDVLDHICVLALQSKSRYIWLDRLCILQVNKQDKVWQISRMHSIYKSCAMCCILPGGIRRLVGLEEETGWIHRGWTLQEAIVPRQSLVLFRWAHQLTGRTISLATAGGIFEPGDVIPGQSASHELEGLLAVAISSVYEFSVDGEKIPISVRLFGTHTNALPTSALMDALTAFANRVALDGNGSSKYYEDALHRASHLKSWANQTTRTTRKTLKRFKQAVGTAAKQMISFGTSRHFSDEASDDGGDHYTSDSARTFDLSEYLPRGSNKNISVSVNKEDDALALKYQSVWRSAFLRTSSHPVDMVFSIMNIFDVSLDPSAFEKNDRLKATIALARAILKRGGKANWIGAAYGLDPSPELSSFPRFPKTSVEGMAYLYDGRNGMPRSAMDVMSESMNGGTYLDGSPDGSMDDAGYLTISAPAAQLSFIEHQELTEMKSHSPLVVEMQVIDSANQTHLPSVTRDIRIIAQDGSVWQLNKSSEVPTSTHLTYLVYIGLEKWSTIPAYASGTFEDPAPIRAWIVQEHSPGKFHRVTFAKLWHTFSLISFPEINLSIGGPNSF